MNKNVKLTAIMNDLAGRKSAEGIRNNEFSWSSLNDTSGCTQ